MTPSHRTALCTVLLLVACNRAPAPAAPSEAGSGSGSAASAPAAEGVAAPKAELLPPPDLAPWLAPAGFTKGAAIPPATLLPLPPGALAAAYRFEGADTSFDALAVRYPNERYARPHVSDVRTPDPGGSKVGREVVQASSLVVELRGADPAALKRAAAAIAVGLGVPVPVEGSGSGVAR